MILKQRVAFNNMLLFPTSEEWVYPDTYQRFKGVWSRIKEKHKCGSEFIAKEKQKGLDCREGKRQEGERIERELERPT